MSATVETLALLKSIDASLRELVALSKSKKRAENSNAAPPPVRPVGNVDLDGPHGNPEIKAKSPRDWSGPDMTGKHLSECQPEYLDLLAERYEYFASKETDEKKKRYAQLDGARARGWAARIRAGWKPTAPAADAAFPSDMMTSDQIDF